MVTSGPNSGHGRVKSGELRRQPDVRISACLESGVPLPAQLLELARGDLIFITDRPLRFGTVIQMAIFTDFVSCVSYRQAVVHWCRASGKGWEIGVYLNRAISDRMTEVNWDGLRSQVRYPCEWKAWVRWHSSSTLEQVRLVNYSMSGLSMRICRNVAGGSEFQLFGPSGRCGDIYVTGRVAWCRITDGAYLAGAFLPGLGGRSLSRLFGNLDSVHVTVSPTTAHGESEASHETRQLELIQEERFLPDPDTEFKAAPERRMSTFRLDDGPNQRHN